MAGPKSPLPWWAVPRTLKAAARSLPVYLPDLIALVQPTISSSHGMSGLPVHFQSFSACVGAGALIGASSNVVAESINAPESAARTIPLTDHPSETAARINKIAKAWRD